MCVHHESTGGEHHKGDGDKRDDLGGLQQRDNLGNQSLLLKVGVV